MISLIISLCAVVLSAYNVVRRKKLEETALNLYDALSELRDEQNGGRPLESRRNKWYDAMEKADQALREYEEL